jgi:hypothetical protein
MNFGVTIKDGDFVCMKEVRRRETNTLLVVALITKEWAKGDRNNNNAGRPLMSQLQDQPTPILNSANVLKSKWVIRNHGRYFRVSCL